jgi:hypothetical protein
VARLHSSQLPAVRLPPDRDWGSKPVPAPDAASSAVMSDSLPADHNSAAGCRGNSATAAYLVPRCVPASCGGRWMRLLTAGCTCDAAADDPHPNIAEATATGQDAANGWPPCCGSETILCGSMSETVSPARNYAQVPGPDPPASRTGSSSAADRETTAAVTAAPRAVGLPPAEAVLNEACSLPPCPDGHQQAACRKQLTKGRTVTICWRRPQ